MSEPRATAGTPSRRPLVFFVLIVLVLTVGGGVIWLVLPTKQLPQISRVQHVPAPAGYAELPNPFEGAPFCVVLEDAGQNADRVREVVERAVTNRSAAWASELVAELPRLVAEALSREEADKLAEDLRAAGATCSVYDAIEHFVQLVADDTEPAMGRPSQVLDVGFLEMGRDSIAELRAAIADGGDAAANRELARDAFLAFTTATGRALYQLNCRPCHGTKGSGDGPLAAGWSLAPVNFRDLETLAALRPGEVLWRIEEGGPGLPDEATPWDSSMPAWKHDLDRELVWKIVLGEFSTANVKPAQPSEHDHAAHGRRSSKAATASDSAARRLPEKSWLDWPVPSKPSADESSKPQFVTRGRYIYYYRCMPCHGVAGRGDGPAADSMWPRPREFTDIAVAGFDDQTTPPKFKFRTTRYGWLPTDEDLFRTISRGLVGTAMEGWSGVLEPNDVWQVIAFIKTFSTSWNDPEHIAKNPNDPVVVKEYTEPDSPGPLLDFAAMTPPKVTPQLIADGAEAFRKIGCWQCHGVEARGDGSALGQHHDEWGYRAWPQNLASPLNYKAGHTVKEIYRDFTAGLNGSVMPTAPPESLDPKDAKRGEYLRWAMAAYVASIVGDAEPKRRKPEPAGVVVASRSRGELPTDPLDPRWEKISAADVPLTGQVVVAPRWTAPSVNRVAIKAMFRAEPRSDSDSAVAIWLRWDDRRPNLAHDESADVWQLPARGNLGPATFFSPALQPKSPVIFGLRDQLELQWPADTAPDARRPYLLYGDDENPVVLWRWLADQQGLNVTKDVVKIENSQAERLVCAPVDPSRAVTDQAVLTLQSRGLRVEPEPLGERSELVRSSAHWANGAWTVVLERRLTSAASGDVQFRAASRGQGNAVLRERVPFAVHVWDGLAGESGPRMATSSWLVLSIKE